MHPSFVKTEAQVAAWERATGIIDKQYPDQLESNERAHAALVTTVYKNIIRVDESSGADWSKAVTMFGVPTISEDFVAVRTEAKDFDVGDYVKVATKLGRTVNHGYVIETTAKMVHIRSTASGVEQHFQYDTGLYSFFRLKYPKDHPMSEGEEPIWVNIKNTVPSDPADSPTTGPMPVRPAHPESRPKVLILTKHLGGGDRHYTETIFQDIEHIGFDRAMERHQIDPVTRSALKADLDRYARQVA